VAGVADRAISGTVAVRRYEPELRALATLYFELARVATRPAEATSAPPATREIAQAHEALSGLATDMSLSAVRYRSLLSQAERIRLSLSVLAGCGLGWLAKMHFILRFRHLINTCQCGEFVSYDC